MIIRILGEGQYQLADDRTAELNERDATLLAAVEAGDVAAFDLALDGLLAVVRAFGSPLPADVLTPSELVLPDADADLAGVRAMLRDDGLIPG